METKDAITFRRSVKQYDPNHKINDKEITELLSLAALSPTAFNIKHWRFIIPESVTSLRHRTKAIDSTAVKKIPA